MEISIQSILNTKTLIPLNSSSLKTDDIVIKHIIFYEGASTLLQTNSIIIIPREYSETISDDLLTTLNNIESCILLYGDDPNLPALTKEPESSKINIFILPIGISLSQFMDACFSVVEKENTALAKDSFDSMQTFFECMMKHRNESDVFMNTALIF